MQYQLFPLPKSTCHYLSGVDLAMFNNCARAEMVIFFLATGYKEGYI